MPVTKKAAKKKVAQMQKIRTATRRSSSGSTTWTSGDEIRFLNSARELISERRYEKKSFTPLELLNVPDHEMSTFYQRYIETCKHRSSWPAMDKETILAEARKLLRDHI